MKKIYLLAGVALLAGTSFAQANRNDASSLFANPGVAPASAKAPLDTVTMETFDLGTPMGSGGWTTWGAWTASGQNDHTSGDWYLETTFPASLSGQPQIPFTAFSGEMAGNVAFINSDAEGGSAFQDALYTSPAIDLSAMTTTPLSLRWQAQWRRFQELHYVNVSNDGGVTWTEFAVDVVDVNTNSDDPQYAEVNISSANGGLAWGTQVLIQFRYDAQWDWFWAFDNLAIIETPADDLKLSNAKHKYDGQIIQYSQIPTDQVVGMAFEAAASNNGAADQLLTQLDISITGAGTFTGSSAPANVPVGAQEQMFTVNGFTPSANGVYDVTYNLVNTGTTDANPADNIGVTSFEVTDYVYAKDNGTLDGWWGPFDDDTDGIMDPAEFIPQYELNATATVNSIQAVFMGGGTTPQTPVGQEIYYNIYYDDGAGGFTPEFDGLGTPVPTYTLTAGDLTDAAGNEAWVNLEFASFTGGTGVVVDPGVSANVYPVVGYAIDSMFMAVSTDAADTTNFMTVFGSTAGETNYFITSVPMIRLNFAPVGLNEEVADVNLGQNMPNPVNGTTTVPFNLVNGAEVTFTVTDMAGKLLETRDLGTLSSGAHTIEFDGSSLANGMYYYSVIVNGKKSTKKFAVAK